MAAGTDTTPRSEQTDVEAPAKPAWHTPSLKRIDVKRTMFFPGSGVDAVNMTTTTIT